MGVPDRLAIFDRSFASDEAARQQVWNDAPIWMKGLIFAGAGFDQVWSGVKGIGSLILSAATTSEKVKYHVIRAGVMAAKDIVTGNGGNVLSRIQEDITAAKSYIQDAKSDLARMVNGFESLGGNSRRLRNKGGVQTNVLQHAGNYCARYFVVGSGTYSWRGGA